MKKPVIKSVQPQIPERGVNLDVPGRALIAQADDRIRWHKQTAMRMAAELKTMALLTVTPATVEAWQHQSRRNDLETKMNGHLEYARFLTFVRQHIVRDRRYRLGLTDMSLLAITPKGSYY